jgi:hypothetical protein
MKAGDRIVEYMTKRQVFFACWEIIGGYIYTPNRELAGREFPECVEVKQINILTPETGIQNNWGVSVRMSAVRLDDNIGETICNALRSSAGQSS